MILHKLKHAVALLVEALHYMPEDPLCQFPMVSLEIFFIDILPAALWPRV
jgi:hypothetical protein